VRAGKDTIAALRAAVAGKPGDLAAQLALAKKLRAIGDRDGATKLLEAIVAKDPRFAAEPAAEAKLLLIQAATFKPELAPADVDLKPLEQFLLKVKSKRVLFLGYDRIAATMLLRDDLKGAAEAAAKAWKYIPPEEVLEWGQNVAEKAYGFHEKLDQNQLKLALQISAKTLEAAEEAAKERGNPFLANALYLHASVQIVNNLRKDAFATMERAIRLDSSNENLKKALERWKAGSK
jgi:hypothetical protein